MTLIASSLITTFQAIALGVLQGVSELFPISSLGHMVLFPHLFGWTNIVKWQSQSESPWLAFIVMLHVGSAIGLLIYFWKGLGRDRQGAIRYAEQAADRNVDRAAGMADHRRQHPRWDPGDRVREHTARLATATPEVAAIFLVVNGIVLLAAERLRRRAEVRELAAREGMKDDGGRRLETLAYREAALIGFGESTALIAGISRDGVVMATGLARGLDNSDAARYGFLLATPIIFAAGLYKIPDLLGHNGNGLRGAAVIAAAAAAVTAVFTVRFLTRYFRRGKLIPFGIYCVLFGTAMVIYNA